MKEQLNHEITQYHSIMDIDALCINTIRGLALDQVQNTMSGHPGAPLGLAPAIHHLFTHQIVANPLKPDWAGRDRFVLSNGHACALQYTILHLCGYEVYTIGELKRFRKVGSHTPGHPERNVMNGIEVTTGPLGQGVANGVGLAIAERAFDARYKGLGGNYTYVVCGDGCLMEGISSEACSLAGTLKLGRLVLIYDHNKISIDGDTEMAFTEDVGMRFTAYGWQVLRVPLDVDGDIDVEKFSQSVDEAKMELNKPTIIILSSIIGHGSLIQGTAATHGAALKEDDYVQLKKRLGRDKVPEFYVPSDVYNYYKDTMAQRGKIQMQLWEDKFNTFCKDNKKLGEELKLRMKGEYPSDWMKHMPIYTDMEHNVATRKDSGAILEVLCGTDNADKEPLLPGLLVGSADLTPSNNTRWKDAIDFQPPNYNGHYIRYGVREHGMGGIMNGITAYGAHTRAIGGTFLNFVSYGCGALRLAAIGHLPVIWVATHDSIGLGEDGPTHQPIETLSHLRSIPNLMVWRPADGNEVSAAYIEALKCNETPSVIALTRQNVPLLKGSSIEKARLGGYILRKGKGEDIGKGIKPAMILISSGSEVSLCVKVSERLESAAHSSQRPGGIRVVSIIEPHIFSKQNEEYKLEILPDGIPIMSVEALASTGWYKYAHEVFGLNRFGASGKGEEVFEFLKFTVDEIANAVENILVYYQDSHQLRSPIRRIVHEVYSKRRDSVF